MLCVVSSVYFGYLFLMQSGQEGEKAANGRRSIGLGEQHSVVGYFGPKYLPDRISSACLLHSGLGRAMNIVFSDCMALALVDASGFWKSQEELPDVQAQVSCSRQKQPSASEQVS